jgi:hypothetical protein
MAGVLEVKSDAPDDGNVSRYFGDFSNESKGKVNEIIDNIAKYPQKEDTLTPRTKQQKNPHTSGDAFFPGAS